MTMYYLVNYKPRVHEGQENKEDKIYQYRVQMDDKFRNDENGEHFAGLSAKCLETNSFKRFRWDRLESIIAIPGKPPIKKLPF